MSSSLPLAKRRLRWLVRVAGVAGFGLIMGTREVFTHGWQRSLAAAVAALVLALTLVQFRKGR